MGKILTLAFKDLHLLWRDKFGLFWVIAFPLLFAIFFGSIFSGGGGSGQSALKVAVVDQDSSESSIAFVQEMQKSDALNVFPLPLDEATRRVRQGKLSAYVLLKKGFGSGVPPLFGGESAMKIGIDPARRAESAYLQGILMSLSFQQMEHQWSNRTYADKQISQIMSEVDTASRVSDSDRKTLSTFLGSLSDMLGSGMMDSLPSSQNGEMSIETEAVGREAQPGQPRSAFDITFPSAIMWGLLGCAASFGISIVKERRGGTYLRLRLAPLSRAHILAGKGMACFMACVGVSVMLIFVGRFIFGVRPDNLVMLAMAVVASAVCFVGIMMAMSVLGKTEDAVAGAGWAILLVMAMLGGGMVPLFFMPSWLQSISSISPIKWGVLSLEGAIWRGFSVTEMMLPVGILVGVGVVFFGIGVYVFSRSEL
jgi:ABC-2 type transport system permease protein